MEDLRGRSTELEAVERFVTSVPGGYRVLAFEGGAGYGKTALLEATVARARAAGLDVLAARPAEAEAEVAFGVLSDLLGGLPEEAFEALPAARRHALEVALRRRESGGRALDPLVIGLALLSVLQAASLEAALLVAVDDLQWCDVPSARALEFALRRLDGEPIGLAATIRVGAGAAPTLPGHRDRVERVRVGPLDEHDFVALLRARTGAGLALPTLRRLHGICEGNPLFGLEVAAALAEVPAAGVEPLPVPTTISAAIGARLAALSPAARELLVAAAALSRPTVSALDAAFPDQDAEAVLEPAVSAGLVTLVGEHVRFSHPLVAAGLYRSASAKRLRGIHGRLAETLSDEEERAVHLALSVSEPDEAVATALEHAAELARARGAPTAAAQLLERSATVTPPGDGDSIYRRTYAAARSHHAAGDTQHARVLLEALVDVPAPAARRAELMLELARVTENDLDLASDHAYAALELARGDAAVELRVRYYLADLHYGAGDAVRGAEHAYAARRAAEADGDERLIAAAVARAANVDAWLGKPVDLDALERAVEVERRLGLDDDLDRPSVMYADYLKRIGRYDESRALHLAEYDQWRRVGDEHTAATILTGLADIEVRAGELEAAIAYATELTEFGDLVGELALFSNGLIHRAGALALLGRVDEAAADVEAGRAAAQEARIEVFVAAFDHVEGLVELERGRPEQARALFERCERSMDSAGVLHPGYRKLPTLIEALLALGRLDEAEVELDRSEARCRPDRDARVLAVTSRYRALLASLRGDHDAAESRFAAALAFDARAPSTYERARTLLALGTARRRSKRRTDAREALRGAAELFEEVGADAWVERCRQEERALGLRRGSGDELTAMEQRVAEVVASGVTTREAAASLYVTPKTIEFHLRNVYRKLGVRSRAELANAVRAPGNGSKAAVEP